MTEGSAPERSRGAFARLWASTTLSALADGLYLIVLPLIALQVTDSPLAIAGIRVAQTGAGFLLGLFVGVLVDRYDRRQLMLYSEAGRGLMMLAVAGAAVFGLLNVPLLFVVAFVVGLAETTTDTSAQALVPMVADRGRLRKANGRIQGAQTVMNDFVGAPLGAALVGLTLVGALAAPALLYLAAAIALLALSGKFAVGRVEKTSVLHDLKLGIVTLWRETTLRRLALYSAVCNFMNMAFFAVFIVFAVGASSEMGLSSFGYSLLLTAAAAGAVSGALLADRITHLVSSRVVLITSVLALGICFGVPLITVHPILVGGALVISGFFTSVSAVASTSLRQLLSPMNLLGRLSAGSRLLTLAARPLGAAAGGAIAQASSPRGLFAVVAVGVLLALPLAWRVRYKDLPGEPGPVAEDVAGAAPPSGDKTNS
ncbi:MFS transporter [Amycolatopsis lurida]|uniref:MFS transporter n=1 Tax=Amycolatopsis lurida TaxID=31959 RepID=UPI003654EBC1